MPPPDAPVRRHLFARGVVQGVGFRPFIYTLAVSCRVAGCVRNEPGGVRIEIEGRDADVARFLARLPAELPPLAVLDSLDVAEVPPRGERAFTIEASAPAAAQTTAIPADTAVCEACRREMADPADRRHRYPFINCTDCGPRFTLILDLPYDRPATTMRAFPLCAACAAEYTDPTTRRFHAEPIACPVCGPHLTFHPTGAPQEAVEREEALAAARAALAAGRIVAIKGIGGFHLACDALAPAAVARLRERKGRGEKPFAVMMRDLSVVRAYVDVSVEEERLLTGRERPIVLLRHREGAGERLAAAVAPGQASIGVLLPYAPLHDLLLDATPLVMTSGNRSDEPIARDNAEAVERLSGLADAFLLHDRGIHAVCDDSVARVALGRELPLRRSRGWAPFPVPLPFETPPLLAVGGELKAVCAVATGRQAFLSQHIGDLGHLETLTAFERAVEHLLRLLRIEPRVVACDLHPDYQSTRWARAWAAERGLPVVAVQHHHAHIASVLAENGVAGEAPVLGVSFDGTGYGTDGTIWGGEILLATARSFQRIGRVTAVPLPGGDAGVRHPARMALAHLRAAGLPWDEDLPPVAAIPAADRRILATQLDRGLAAPLTTSCGRLFDAVAALIGLRPEVTYEGQAAMELEALADKKAEEPYRFDLRDDDGLVLDPAPVLRALVADLRAGVGKREMASRFHDGLAAAVVAACQRLGRVHAVQTVALSGGVFQNVRFLTALVEGLTAAGFAVLTHRRVPPNDGGLALGQVAVAAVQACGWLKGGGAGGAAPDR
ncbi:MAG TPA: carbamoyltransferase HypF [Acidobacteria bacterium]|nr:carbamoyltransferase HypF [Acidobacteriota bacterium]